MVGRVQGGVPHILHTDICGDLYPARGWENTTHRDIHNVDVSFFSNRTNYSVAVQILLLFSVSESAEQILLLFSVSESAEQILLLFSVSESAEQILLLFSVSESEFVYSNQKKMCSFECESQKIRLDLQH
jgi:hypothetical protein